MKIILYNANIITMKDKSIKQAVCYESGKILKVGNNEEILNLKDNKTNVIDMKGNTILPGFIDSHSHFTAVANGMLQVDLENCRNFKKIKKK